MSHSESLHDSNGTIPNTTNATNEPGMAIDPKLELDRTRASQLLTDSVLALCLRSADGASFQRETPGRS